MYVLRPHTMEAYLWLNTNLDINAWNIGYGVMISGECIVEICSEINNDELNFTGDIH